MSKLSNQNKVIVGVLSLFLILIVGYAIFSESINVGGTASASGEFNIIFNSVGTIKEEGSSGATAEISSNKKSLTVNVPKLEYPSAYVEVPVVIKNMGSVTAKIIGIETVGLDTTDIKVTYSGIGQDERMAPNEERNMKIKVTWDSASTTIVDSLTFSISINYEQATEEIIIPPAQKELFTWDSDTVISGLTADGIAEVKANGGHLVIPEGVTEIASPSFNMNTGEGLVNKGFSPYAIGKLDLQSATEEQVRENSIITSVSFPSTLTKVGNYAFIYNQYLTGTLTLPNGLQEIGDYAFAMTMLNGDLSLPQNLTRIGDSAFAASSLKGDLIIPNGVTVIEPNAFSSTAINSLTIGTGVITIKERAFYGCAYLTGPLVIPDNVQTIEGYVFMGTKLTSLKIGTGLKTIGTQAFDNIETLSGELYFPDSVEEIGNSAFSIDSAANNKLTSISVYSATGRGAYAFNKRESVLTIRPLQ